MTDRDARQLPGPLDRLADETGSVIGPRPDPAPASGKRFGRDLHARRRDEAALRRDVNASDRDRRAHTRDTELAQLQAAYVAARQPADEALPPPRYLPAPPPRTTSPARALPLSACRRDGPVPSPPPP